MNILKHKSWHVRTIKNIARVREDEAKAAEEEKERKRRILLAEQEARTAILRQRSRDKYGSVKSDLIDEPALDIKDESERNETEPRVEILKHVNLFEDLEEGNVVSTKVNADHVKEQKEEREKYEKQIGYLTYLGQDTVELTGNVAWYDKVPAHVSELTASEKCSKPDSVSKSKLRTDPLNDIRRYLKTKEEKRPSRSNIRQDSTVTPETSRKRKRSSSDQSSPEKHKKARKHKEKVKSKKHRHKRCKHRKSSKSRNKSESDDDSTVESGRVDIAQLRAERLKRELAEKTRAEKLLSKLRGDPEPEEKPVKSTSSVAQKYNSQFNPQLAKQNYKQDDQPYGRRR